MAAQGGREKVGGRREKAEGRGQREGREKAERRQKAPQQVRHMSSLLESAGKEGNGLFPDQTFKTITLASRAQGAAMHS